MIWFKIEWKVPSAKRATGASAKPPENPSLNRRFWYLHADGFFMGRWRWTVVVDPFHHLNQILKKIKVLIVCKSKLWFPFQAGQQFSSSWTVTTTETKYDEHFGASVLLKFFRYDNRILVNLWTVFVCLGGFPVIITSCWVKIASDLLLCVAFRACLIFVVWVVDGFNHSTVEGNKIVCSSSN